MAKLKAAKPKGKTSAKSALRAVPCLVLIAGIFVLFSILFLYALKG